MKEMGIGEKILSAFFGLLIINFFVPGGVIYQVKKMFESPPIYVRGRGLTESQIKNINNHERLHGLGVVKHFNEINRNRHFKISYYVPLDILVDNNGNQFPQEKQFLMLKSYGKQRAEFECKLLLQTLANVCEVLETTAKLEIFGHNKKKFVNLWMKLLFVQKTDFGVMPENVSMVFKELNKTVYDDRDNLIRASDTKTSAAWRLKIYKMISDVCMELKSLRTNCAISRAQLKPEFHLRTNKGYFSLIGTARFAYLE